MATLNLQAHDAGKVRFDKKNCPRMTSCAFRILRLVELRSR